MAEGHHIGVPIPGTAKPRFTADPRQALADLAADRGESLAALSRMLGHGSGYLHRFIKIGVPLALSEIDHRLLVDYFGAGKNELGIRDLWATSR